jgi:hypothetical protein
MSYIDPPVPPSRRATLIAVILSFLLAALVAVTLATGSPDPGTFPKPTPRPTINPYPTGTPQGTPTPAPTPPAEPTVTPTPSLTPAPCGFDDPVRVVYLTPGYTGSEITGFCGPCGCQITGGPGEATHLPPLKPFGFPTWGGATAAVCRGCDSLAGREVVMGAWRPLAPSVLLWPVPLTP